MKKQDLLSLVQLLLVPALLILLGLILLVNPDAVLDRRVGKRRLHTLWENLSREESVLRDFYFLRLEAEGMDPGKVFSEK